MEHSVYHALMLDDLDEFKRMIKNSDLERTYEFKNGMTLLGIAVSLGKKEYIRCLMDAGSNLFAKDEFGHNLIMIAVIRNHRDVLEMLLDTELRREIEYKDLSGYTALLHACANTSESCLELLLEKGANPNASLADQRDALSIVVDSPRMLEALLMNGAELGDDHTGNNALTRALVFHESESVELLLKYIQNINRQCFRGKTALHYASSVCKEYVERIVEMGGNPAIRDHRGHTPVMWAYLYDRIDVLRYYSGCIELLDKEDADLIEKSKLRWMLKN